MAQRDVDRALAALELSGARAGTPIWLSPNQVCDIPFLEAAEPVLVAARGLFEGRAVDVNVVHSAFRRKKLLLADMDSTLIEQECIDELAAEAGWGPEVAAITERAMRGEIGFEPALRARVALLRGLRVAAVEQALKTRISFTPGAATLVATMRAAGAYAALVSGGFSSFTGPIAERLGFDEERSNHLIEADGVLTGEVAEPIFGRAGKEEALLGLTEKLALAPAETLAIGDGANDLGIIRLAGLGAAFHAKPALRAAADAVIDPGDLTAILFLQGFFRDEFAPASPNPKLP